MNLVMLIYPSLLFFIFIFIPSFLVAFFSTDTLSVLVFKVTATGLFVFTFFSVAVYLNLSKRKLMFSNGITKTLMLSLFLIFCSSYIYLALDYKGFPVVEYLFNGGAPNELRAGFYKDKEGIAQIAVYIRSILTKGFIPVYAVYAFLFYGRKSFSFVLAVYLFFSLMTFEKSAILWFVLPVVTLLLYRKKYKLLSMYVFIAAFSIALMGVLQQSNSLAENQEVSGFRDSFRIDDSLHNVENYQFFFTDIANKKTLPFLLDRMFWIPFVTVYDTLYYWTKNYDDYLYASTNRHLATITGSSFANLEREVFIFQYGGGEGTTGNANASYIAEAYLMFGFVGVVFFSAVFGSLNGYVVSVDNKALTSAFSVYPFAIITSASFLSMMFSGGLFLYLILFHFLTVRYKL